MHKLGDQWVELFGDGKWHMLKCARNIPEMLPEIYNHIDSFSCNGCVYFATDNCDGSADCTQDKCACQDIGCIVVDLGIIDENGCLPEERTGKYPTISDRNAEQPWLGHIWDCVIKGKLGNDDGAIEIRVSALTRPEVIDRWNQRWTS